jgi:ADP-heptose:LPS heptosyltransferase
MKILFITATRLGDGVLSTGILAHFIRQYPAAEITVACGGLVAGLFEQAPNVVRVIALKKEPYALHWRKLWRETYQTRWDIIIDLRNSLISRLLRADKKYIWGRQDKNKHKVEQLAELIGVAPPPAPTLWFSEKILQQAENFIPDGTAVLAIGPTANWAGKTWRVENFIALVQRLTAAEGLFPQARVAVFAAPGEEEIAYQLLKSIPAERQIDMIAKAAPVVVSAALQRCQFYIGNDSGLMHCSAAVGTPTLGLFGPSFPVLYHPWGAHCAYVATPETYEELTSYHGYHHSTASSLMDSLTVGAVTQAALQLFQRVNSTGKQKVLNHV